MWGALQENIQRLARDRHNASLLPGIDLPPGVELTTDDARCFPGCSLIVSAIPTQYMRAVWTRLKDLAPRDVPIVSVAKGIENDSLLRPTQIIADVLFSGQPNLPMPLVALSGPNIAAELGRHLPATAVAACADDSIARAVQQLFSTNWLRVYTNSDVIGTELAGATKNVIAIAAGILDGLAAGDNAKAALVTRGLVEITRLGLAMGAIESTFSGLAGLGDLITTCVSPLGRNRTLGEQIGKGRKLPEILSSTRSVVEGVATTQSVVELSRRVAVEMPIAQAVHSVLFEQVDPRQALTQLMAREAKAEA